MLIQNFSSHILSKEEQIGLSYGLKNPVPHRLKWNGIMTECGYPYQQISYHTKPQWTRRTKNVINSFFDRDNCG